MNTSLATAGSKTAADIWGRVVIPGRGAITPEVAKLLLKITFSEEDQGRITALLEKNREDVLTPDEQEELEEFVRLDAFLSIIQSKARLSLKKAGLAP
jgi:hypothetical protein